MGRAKLSMELISKEKSRNVTFKKRKEGLIRKMYEFTTLCDVNACMIIYGPHPEKPTIWPHNPEEVRRIIDIYKAKHKDGNKTFGLFDFFHERRRKIEDEVSKLRKKNMEAKYPMWLELLNSMSEGQLRDFAAALGNKAEYVKTRVEMLSHARFYCQPPVPPPMCYPAAAAVDLLNQNSMMMLLMNERQVIYGASSSSGVVDPMLPRYYAAPQRVLQILDPLEGEMLSEHHRIEAAPAPTPSMPAPPSYEEINSVPGSTDSMGYFLGEAMYSYQAESDVELNLCH